MGGEVKYVGLPTKASLARVAPDGVMSRCHGRIGAAEGHAAASAAENGIELRVCCSGTIPHISATFPTIVILSLRRAGCLGVAFLRTPSVMPCMQTFVPRLLWVDGERHTPLMVHIFSLTVMSQWLGMCEVAGIWMRPIFSNLAGPVTPNELDLMHRCFPMEMQDARTAPTRDVNRRLLLAAENNC